MANNVDEQLRTLVSQDSELATEDAPTSMGLFYPEGHILAVIDDRREAERAVQTLRESGVPAEDIELMDGAWFTESIHDIREHRNPLERLLAFLAVEEREFIQAYVEESEAGHSIVVVQAEQADICERVAEVLARHGGRELRHYGRFVITDL
jgi:hypothetical protein